MERDRAFRVFFSTPGVRGPPAADGEDAVAPVLGVPSAGNWVRARAPTRTRTPRTPIRSQNTIEASGCRKGYGTVRVREPSGETGAGCRACRRSSAEERHRAGLDAGPRRRVR